MHEIPSARPRSFDCRHELLVKVGKTPKKKVPEAISHWIAGQARDDDTQERDAAYLDQPFARSSHASVRFQSEPMWSKTSNWTVATTAQPPAGMALCATRVQFAPTLFDPKPNVVRGRWP